MTTATQPRELALQALVKANRVRQERARLKRNIEAGRVSIADLVLHPPPFMGKARIGEFLLAVPKVGRAKAARILRSQGYGDSKTFGALTERQRNELSEALR